MSELPFQAEYAKSGRAMCKGCREKIDQGHIRLAAMVQSAFFDGKQANWYHEDCFFQKQRPQSVSEIGKLHSLRNPDRLRIKEKIESMGSGAVLPVEKPKGKKGKRKNEDAKSVQGALQDFRVEYSKSSRATCRVCEMKICKDEVRICKIVFDTEVGQKYGGQPLWHHPKCFTEARIELGFLAAGELLPGFKDLSKEDKAMIKKDVPSMSADETPVKKLKAEAEEVKKEKEEKKVIEGELEAQSKLFFRYRDSLRKHYSKSDFVNLLIFNSQECPEGTEEILDLLADVIAFGALQPCPVCKNGQFYLDTHGYVCKGNVSEWTKCTNTSQDPKRVPFKVPKNYDKKKTFKGYKPSVGKRVFEVAPKPSASLVKTESLYVKKEPKSVPPLKNLNFFLYGQSKDDKEEIKRKILKLGGNVSSKVTDELAAVVSTKKHVEKMPAKMEEINQTDIEVVEESLFDLIDKDTGTVKSSLDLIKEHNIAPWGSDPTKRVPQDVIDGKSIYKSKSLYVKSGKSTSKKLKIKGGTAVDPESGLEDVAHVYLDDYGTKWTVVLGKTDVVAQKNSYYKLQLLEADTGNKYWLFRAWGRIGTTIGGNKTEPCKDLYDGKSKFEELYFDRTENPWEMRDHFMKVPDKMYPIDLDYGADDNAGPLKEDKNCKLPLPVQKFVITIFDINLMKKALLEFDLDTEKMPLGRLSKKQIKEGYKQLTQLLKIVSDESKKENSVSKIIDATNKFYTFIPHDCGVQNPPILDNEKIIKTKIDMLDNLLEIEIAYNLLKTDTDNDQHSPIEAHYLKLKTELMPLDLGSPESELLKKYVSNTHAKTHQQYTLEIEHIFKVVRDGEEKRYKPFKKLHNRRLLWHGSRITNFAGILSQGLRIAPPEAPATGYMFGKGIYFADMVSKSANYCNTSKASPTGVLLLSEVALGNMKECHRAEFVQALPAGTHSVHGMGRTMPDPAQDVVLEDKTIVPLGTPVERKLQTDLLYNEFIVYDIAQVNVKYLLQMKFNYKY